MVISMCKVSGIEIKNYNCRTLKCLGTESCKSEIMRLFRRNRYCVKWRVRRVFSSLSAFCEIAFGVPTYRSIFIIFFGSFIVGVEVFVFMSP